MPAKLTLNDIERVFPAVVAVPVHERYHGAFTDPENPNGHCVVGHFCLQLGIEIPGALSVFSVFNGDDHHDCGIDDFFDDEANNRLDELMEDWESRNIWPGEHKDE